MLILVGVTINFALNGGIITKAKEASTQMQKAADLEELQLAVVSSLDYQTGILNVEELETTLSNWTITGEGPYICISSHGNTYTVTEGGIVTEGIVNSGQTTSEDSSTSPEEPEEPEEPGSNSIDHTKAYNLTFNDLTETLDSDDWTYLQSHSMLMMFAPSTYNDVATALSNQDICVIGNELNRINFI